MVSNGKRIAYGRNQNRVNTTTYPDDTSVPVRTSHWNQDPHDQAILGFTKITATLDASDVLITKDDTTTFTEADGNTYSKQSTLIEVECNASLTTDIISKIDITDTNENDIVYLFKATAGDTITISSITPSADGHIKTQLSGGATLVHDGVPIMLIRRGNYWYEFGADGAAVASSFTASSSDTLSGKAISLTTNTLTGTSAELKTAISDETGSGELVFGTSPTLVTPVLGIPASGTLTDCDGLPPAGVVGTAAILGANTFTGNQSQGDNVISLYGTGSDLKIHHNGSDNLIEGIAGNMLYYTPVSTIHRFLINNVTQVDIENQYMNTQNIRPLTDSIWDLGTDAKQFRNIHLNQVVYDITALATATDIGFDETGLQTSTFGADHTYTMSNIAAGKSKTIQISNSSAANRTATFPANIKWVGTAPTSNAYTILANKTAIVTFTCFGTAITDVMGAFAAEE
tara:strand:- start:2702 stop:4078 length:1377 start_codon:yes stop_codon:yes gene_type:complete